MKVLAEVEKNEKFICEVSQNELKDFMNTYSSDAKMYVGKIIDLSKGHDFARDALRSMNATEKFISSNKEVIKSIIEGVKVFKNIEDQNG